LRAEFSPSLGEDLPLIATTAEQYVGLAGQDLSAAHNERMIVAEGVLREAGDRLEGLLNGEGKVDAPVIGLIRMDTNAEVLAERMSADTNDAARRATAARVRHALKLAARVAEDGFASDLHRAAVRVDEIALDEAVTVPDNAAAIIEASEKLVNEASEANEKALRRQIRKLL